MPNSSLSKSVLGAGFSLHSSASNPFFVQLSPSVSNLVSPRQLADAKKFNQTITGSKVEIVVNEEKVLLHNRKKALSKSLDPAVEITNLSFTEAMLLQKLEKEIETPTAYGRVDAECNTQFELMSVTSANRDVPEWPAPLQIKIRDRQVFGQDHLAS
jgi:hypothetical protein